MLALTRLCRTAPIALVAALAAVLALLVAPTTQAAAPASQAAPAQKAVPWAPYLGITFNNPIGPLSQRNVIVRRIHAAIDHTPAGETIRIATYNLGLKTSADKLIAAKKRGVRVQVIVNANLIGPLEARVQRALGKNPNRASFLYVCSDACRNSAASGNMHLKIYSFTRTGTAKQLFISSSSNLGGPAMHGQWNDSVALAGQTALFTTWWRLFDQMRHDRAVSPRRVNYVSSAVSAYFQRLVPGGAQGRVTTSKAITDAPYVRLRGVTCVAPKGYGSNGRTVITVNMRAWYATRGERLASLLAARKAGGCKVRVIGSLMSKEVVRILLRAKIPVKAADWQWGPRPSTSDADETVYGPSCYSHLKYVTVNGTYHGRGDRLVWTGSENWSPPGLSSDEVTLELHGAQTVKAYNDQWAKMWASGRTTHRVGIEPKYRPCA